MQSLSWMVTYKSWNWAQYFGILEPQILLIIILFNDFTHFIHKYFIKKKSSLFIWLCWVLVAASELLDVAREI